MKKPPRSISKHLYSEVKHFFEDLLINQWIFKFYSSYACPVVHVRKKDSDKRLCVDYRELNGKIVLNIVPIPKVSDILDHIGGQLYFTTLGITNVMQYSPLLLLPHPGYYMIGFACPLVYLMAHQRLRDV